MGATLEKNGEKIATVKSLQDFGYPMSEPKEIRTIDSVTPKAIIPPRPIGPGRLVADLIFSEEAYTKYFPTGSVNMLQVNKDGLNDGGLVLVMDNSQNRYEGCVITEVKDNASDGNEHIISVEMQYCRIS